LESEVKLSRKSLERPSLNQSIIDGFLVSNLLVDHIFGVVLVLLKELDHFAQLLHSFLVELERLLRFYRRHRCLRHNYECIAYWSYQPDRCHELLSFSVWFLCEAESLLEFGHVDWCVGFGDKFWDMVRLEIPYEHLSQTFLLVLIFAWSGRCWAREWFLELLEGFLVVVWLQRSDNLPDQSKLLANFLDMLRGSEEEEASIDSVSPVKQVEQHVLHVIFRLQLVLTNKRSGCQSHLSVWTWYLPAGQALACWRHWPVAWWLWWFQAGFSVR
jgi:hypothetical protein